MMSPKLVQWYVEESWDRLVRTRVAAKFCSIGYEDVDMVNLSCVRRVLESNTGDQLTPLTPLQKDCLRALFVVLFGGKTG